MWKIKQIARPVLNWLLECRWYRTAFKVKVEIHFGMQNISDRFLTAKGFNYFFITTWKGGSMVELVSVLFACNKGPRFESWRRIIFHRVVMHFEKLLPCCFKSRFPITRS
jgi:hypothetical protein